MVGFGLGSTTGLWITATAVDKPPRGKLPAVSTPRPDYERATGSLRLRGGYVPPEPAHVLRGGTLLSSDLDKTARACERVFGVLGVSVFVAEVREIEDLIAQARPIVREMPALSVCSFAALVGFHVVPSGKAPHYTVLLPDLTEPTFELLREPFLVVPNPLLVARGAL